MDSVILASSEEQKLSRFLEKMGYAVRCCAAAGSLTEAIQQGHPDLVILDTDFELDSVDFLSFLRAQPETREVPVLLLARNTAVRSAVEAEHFPRVEILPMPSKIGAIVSKAVTQLRLRKINGAEEATASLGEINARLRDLNECFQKQLDEARTIQQSLVAQNLPRDDRFSLAVSYEPLEDVGGDWYYVQQEADGRIRVHCADVTGHGLSAAFIGSMTKLAMNAAGPLPPDKQLQEMNRLMVPNIPSGKFVTMLTYLYDPATGAVEVARGGHPPALLLRRRAAEVQRITGSGFAIGFFDDSEYSLESACLDPGDVLVTFSDAIPESQNMAGDTYDYDRLSEVLLTSSPDAPATDLLRLVLSDFDDFRDGRLLKDDVTVILLKREQ